MKKAGAEKYVRESIHLRCSLVSAQGGNARQYRLQWSRIARIFPWSNAGNVGESSVARFGPSLICADKRRGAANLQPVEKKKNV